MGHLPKHCPNYGWYFPAPGKMREDYAEDRQRVLDLIAADIVHEHDPDETEDDQIVFGSQRPSAEHKTQALQLTCKTCGQEQGQKCKTAAGAFCDSPHKARLDAVDLGPLGR